MLDKRYVVDIPEGSIIKSDRRVFWTIQKVYLKDKQYNHDKRRLIGKTLEASRTKMYPNDNFIELFPEAYQKAIGKKPAPSYQRIGMYLAVKTITEQLPLYSTLIEVFGKEDADLILDYAMYQIIYATDVSQHFESSMEDKALFSEKLRSDSYISQFFHHNITEDKIDLFLELWASRIIAFKHIHNVYMNVDGSNIDNEAEGVTIKELGHDKSGEGTTIVGIMYVVGPDGTGVFYHQYRGSIIDSKAVMYVYKFFKHLDAKIEGFCADRGFCTKDGVDLLRGMKCNFVLMMTSKPEGFTEAKNKIRDSIRNNMKKWIEGTELFADTTCVKMFKNDTCDSYLHVLYDSAQSGIGIKSLLRQINRAVDKARKNIKKKKEPGIPSELRQYVHLRSGRGPKTLVVEYEKIQEAINDKGFHVLATSENMKAKRAWEIYHVRDASETQYMFMKSELGLDVYRAGNDKSIAAKQFVAFIAGIIRNEIKLASIALIDQYNRSDWYSVPAIIQELETIRIKRLPGNEYALVMDISERDEAMLNALKIPKTKLEECAISQNLRIKGTNR